MTPTIGTRFYKNSRTVASWNRCANVIVLSIETGMHVNACTSKDLISKGVSAEELDEVMRSTFKAEVRMEKIVHKACAA
eukprot:3299449-Amphidinium_carterae.2